jgi:hypothetical protein
MLDWTEHPQRVLESRGPRGRRSSRRAPGASREEGKDMAYLDPDRLQSLIENLRELGEILGGIDLDEDVDKSADWGEFLESHPELTEQKRLEVTDENVYKALLEIHAQEHYGKGWPYPPDWNFPCASGVRRLLLMQQDLFSRPSHGNDHSDLMRVVAALKRLENAGRVEQEVCYVYGQRRSSDWHPSRSAISTGEAD